MKRALLIALLLLSALLPLPAQIDAAQRGQLAARLDEYFAAMAGMRAAQQSEECDFIISSCGDSLVRSFVTLYVYEHYRSSRILGDDAVALHVAEKWLLSGEVPMASEIDRMNVRLFVEFNRHSLIGMQAPALVLRTPSYEAVPFPDGDGRYRILYFYDTDCASCRLEAGALQRLLEERDDPVELLAVYVGDDAAAWARWRAERLRYQTARLRVSHYWDPEGETDFQRLYNVLSTPQLFLLAPDGTILGRGLDPESLGRLLGRVFDGTDYDYGGAEASARFDEAFAGGVSSADEVMAVADYMAAATLGAGDIAAFKHAVGDLLYWLGGRRGEAFRESRERLIDKYILSEGSVFTTQEDSLKLLGLARMIKDLGQLAPIGEKVPDLRVKGVLRQGRRVKAGTFRLRCLRGRPAWVVFYSTGCGGCRETLAAVDALLDDPAQRKTKVLLVDMDAVFAADPEMGTRLLEHFDLSALPFVMQLDRRGVVQRKYVELR